MPLIKRSCIESIKDTVDIYDVVSPYVQLKKTGATWRGLSPFNNEKTPSFFVIPEKKIFKCFSTGNAGDIFRFLQLKENLNFQEAIETIAARFNIKLEYEEGRGGSKDGYSVKKEIFEIHELAASYFNDCFKADNAHGVAIQEYWEKDRGFPKELAERFSIGFAPVSGNALITGLIKRKFSTEALKQCGLFYAREQDRDPNYFRPRFRGRLMIPIRDVQARVIAFAGRQLPMTPQDDPAREAKYINSPETPIFHKSHTIFGLDQARKNLQQKDYFLLVEGQLDVLRCAQHGFDTAVAPQGTSITENQLATIKRYVSKIYCILDGDSAGQNAALRMLPMAFKAGLEVLFIALNEDSDPDTLLLKEGADGLQEKLDNPLTAIEFCSRMFLPNGIKHSPQEKAQAIQKIFEIIINCDSALAQEEYLVEISRITQTKQQALQVDFKRFLQSQKMRSPTPELLPAAPRKVNKEKLTTVEHQLLLLVFHSQEIANSLAQAINPEWITLTTEEGKLLLKVLAEVQEGIWTGNSCIDSLLETDAERNLAYNILGEEIPFEEPLRTANICLKKLYTSFINDQKGKIEEEITNHKGNNADFIRTLQEQRIQLRKDLKHPPQLDVSVTPVSS